jgi:hypothetical protein
MNYFFTNFNQYDLNYFNFLIQNNKTNKNDGEIEAQGVSTDGTCLNALFHVPLHYIPRDRPKAHELTNHILQPSPATGRRSPGAPEKTV